MRAESFAATVFAVTLVMVSETLGQEAPIQSPVLHPDHTVSLALEASSADSVIAVVVYFDRMDTLEMDRDAEGIWRGTFGPLDPGYYQYSFVIDGRYATDRSNDRRTMEVYALLLVPDKPPAFFEEQDVPRGILHHHRHRSSVYGDWRSYVVYTPPGYETEDGRLPVLYLLHGGAESGDWLHLAWEDIGGASVIVDNLIADGTSVPMIVVMPNMLLSLEETHALGLFSKEWLTRTVQGFPKYLREELIPAVDGSYRTRSDVTSRGIAGLSTGGMMSLLVGLTHTDMFGWVGAFSPYMPPDQDELFNRVGELKEPTKLLWLACGRADWLYEANELLRENLSGRGIAYVARTTDGQHTWSVWQDDLRNFVGLIFR